TPREPGCRARGRRANRRDRGGSEAVRLLPKTRRGRLALAGGLLAALVLAGWCYDYRPWEARYQGRPTSWWAGEIPRWVKGDGDGAGGPRNGPPCWGGWGIGTGGCPRLPARPCGKSTPPPWPPTTRSTRGPGPGAASRASGPARGERGGRQAGRAGAGPAGMM